MKSDDGTWTPENAQEILSMSLPATHSSLEPVVIPCDNDKGLANHLIAALTSFSNTTARVFVLYNVTSAETVVALLPTPGPSLAAALRDWVIDWWSDDDTEEYGSPKDYLQDFTIVQDFTIDQ